MTAAPPLDEAPSGRTPRGRFLRWRRPLPWTVFALVLLVVLAAAAAAWIGVRALLAKDALEEAQTLIGDLSSTAVAEPEAAPGLAERIVEETGSARALTSDLVWRGGELIPVLGANLTIVRELAANVDDVARDAVQPLAAVLGDLDPARLKPVDGRIDLAPLAAAAGSAAQADATVVSARDRVTRLDASGTIGPVRDAHEQLAGLLAEAAGVTSAVRAAAELAPPMLGADGSRDYLLMVQNNAEARSLGGNPAALVLLHVDDGRIQITRQASSLDFPRDSEPPIELDPGLYAAYTDFGRYVMDITTRPDFPTAARLAKGYWEREFGGTIDGVLSFDPVALGYLLDATGPVDLVTGDRLDSGNAVRLLLSEVYARYDDPRAQDAFFGSAAAEIFGAVTGGSIDAPKALDALSRAADEGRLMAWSAFPDEEALLAELPLGGVLPPGNDERTTMGVYFMDQSSSKMDYYLETAVAVASDLCTAEEPVFDATVTLTSAISQEEADRLPAYVASHWWKSEQFRTDVFVVGAPGTRFDETSTPDALLSTGSDGDRPVARFTVYLRPGQTAEIDARFLGASGSYGPLEVRTTPMVRPTAVSVGGCDR